MSSGHRTALAMSPQGNALLHSKTPRPLDAGFLGEKEGTTLLFVPKAISFATINDMYMARALYDRTVLARRSITLVAIYSINLTLADRAGSFSAQHD